jgi:predicted Zn-dependent protease
MLFLKFSRADESQADRLGFKYMLDGGYDPREMTDVFSVLQKVSQQAGAGRLPQWMSSHPDPENRQAWAARAVANLKRDLSGLTVNRQPYLRQLDGIVFGENPREGFFEGALFRHPDMAFRIEFPPGWKTSNQKQAVSAVSPQQDAVVALQGAGAPSAQQAAQQFFSQQGVEAGQPWRRQIGGFPAVSYSFRAQTQQGILRGLVAWIEYQNNVFRLLGYTPEGKWPQYERAFAESIASFNRETDRAVLEVKPRRLKIVELNHPATLEALLRDYPSTVAPQTVALINNLTGNATLAAGDDFKRVIGGQLP